MKLFGRRAAVGNRQDVESAGPLRRFLDGVRSDAEMRANVVLPQYAKPGRRTTVLMFCIVLAGACFAYGFSFGLMAPARIVQFVFPLMALGALTVWALPELGKAPTRTIEKFFFAFLLSIPLWPNYLAIALPGLPWITMQRLIGFPLVFMLLVSISISQFFRRDMRDTLEGTPTLWRFVAAFAVLQVLTLAVSNAPQISFQKLLVTQVNWTAMFFVAVYAFRKPLRAEIWAALLIFAAVVVALISIREAQVQQVLWAGHIPSFLAVDDPAVQRSLSVGSRAGTDRYRSQSTFATPLGLGEFLAITTPFVLHFIGGPFRLWIRLIALMILPLVFVGIYMTDTRLSVVGFIMSIGLYIFFWGAMHWKMNPRSMVGPAVVLSYPATALAFIVAILVVPRLRLMTLGGGQHQASTEARYSQWEQGIPLVLSNPWGFGIGRGANALGYVNPGGVMTIDTYWLLTALDYGIVGFVLFYGTYLIAMWKAFWTVAKGVKDRELLILVPITISLFVYVVIKSIYAGIENQSITFMMLGAVVALVYRAKMEKAEEGGAPVQPTKRHRRM